MRLLACLFLVAACVCPAAAAGGSFVRGPIMRGPISYVVSTPGLSP
jgi:hypothetical protein